MANPITQIILTAVDKTKAAFASVTGGMKSLGQIAGSLKGVLGSVFAGFTVLRVVGGLKSAVNEMDAAHKAAQKLGTSVENFTALKFAAGQSGIEVEALQTGLAKLSRTLDDAKGGMANAVDTFARLKIDPKQFKDPSDALAVIADSFASMPDGVNKTALAMQLFGKAGAQMIPLLNQGANGIAELKREAEKLGVVISTETAIAAEKFNDNLDSLEKAAKGLGYTLATDSLGALNDVVEAMAKGAKEAGLMGAAMALIKEINPFNDFLYNEQLDAIRRLKLAEEQLAGLRKDGFDEDQHRVVQLKEMIPLIRILADEEKRAAAEKDKAKQVSYDFAESKKVEAEAFKKATTEEIKDTERLAGAIRTAWESALSSQEDYLKQAKKLRDEASVKPKDSSIEGQASSMLDLIYAEQKLQRIRNSAPLEDVQAQAEHVRELAANLDNQARAQDAVNFSKLAEADALDKAAAAHGEQARALIEQGKEQQRRLDNMKGALDGLGKEVSVDITLSPRTKAALADMEKFKYIIDYIETKKPNVSVSSPVSAQQSNDLKTAALQYGRRQ